MTVAYDTSSRVAGIGTGNLSWTHTPTGTPKGVIVWVVQNVGITDEITSVTYGGVALAEVSGSPLFVDVGTEDGTVYAYFLGSGIPTGAQTVAVNVNGTGSTKDAVCTTVTASTSTTEVLDAQYIDYTEVGTTATPSLSVTVPAFKSAYVGAAMFTGQGVVASISVGTGCTEVYETDFGNQAACYLRRTSIEVGATAPSCSWNLTSADEAGILALAVGEPLQTVPVADRAEETDESRTLSAIRSITVDRAEETDTARNLANYYVPRVEETDTSRTIVPLVGGYPKFSGARTFSNDLTVDVAAASSGDVVVGTASTLDALDVNVPAGVTIRGDVSAYQSPRNYAGFHSASEHTWIVSGGGSTRTIGDYATLRDMWFISSATAAFTFSGSAWFENVTFYNVKIATKAPPNADDTVTFSRCTFYVGSDKALIGAADPTTTDGNFSFYDCLFIDERTAGTASPLFTMGQGDWTFTNCTFKTTGAPGDWWDEAASGGGFIPGRATFRNCVFDVPLGGLDNLTTVVGGTTNYGTATSAVGETVVTNLYMSEDDTPGIRFPPTNRSPYRSGGSAAYTRRLDRDYLPYDTSAPSAGAHQWRAASTSLTRGWNVDPLDGFAMTYGDQTLDTTTSHTRVKSHLDVAYIVRSYVYDHIHPSRQGDFYTTWDGYYRLALNSGAVDLTVTSPASRIFGAQALTDTGDTG